jgi:hypothetical protein
MTTFSLYGNKVYICFILSCRLLRMLKSNSFPHNQWEWPLTIRNRSVEDILKAAT